MSPWWEFNGKICSLCISWDMYCLRLCDGTLSLYWHNCHTELLCEKYIGVRWLNIIARQMDIVLRVAFDWFSTKIRTAWMLRSYSWLEMYMCLMAWTFWKSNCHTDVGMFLIFSPKNMKSECVLSKKHLVKKFYCKK